MFPGEICKSLGCKQQGGNNQRRELRDKPDAPADERGDCQDSAAFPIIGLAMMFAQTLIIDEEVQAHGDAVDEEAAQIRHLPVQEEIADQHAVDRKRAEVGPERAT